MSKLVILFTGLSGSGKSSLVSAVASKLNSACGPVKILDGDVARTTFSRDLTFSSEDRHENIRRAAYIASYLSIDSIVLASFISPYKSQRDYMRSMCDNFAEIYVSCPIEICKSRDPKGMYSKLVDGKFNNNPFTGVHNDAPYEPPENPDLIIYTNTESVDKSAERVINFIEGWL